MKRAADDKDWANVIPAAEEVVQMYADDKTNKLYLTARYMIVASHYTLKDYAKVVETARALIDSGELKAGEGKNALTPKEAATYDNQVFYFLFDSYTRLAAEDPTMREKAVAVFDEYAAKYTSTNLVDEAPLSDKIHYAAMAQLKTLYDHAKDDKTAEAYRDRALKVSDHVAASWPTSDVYPTTELLAGGLLLNHTDEALKPTAMGRLENAVNAGLALKTDSGRATAANGLFWLATYASEYPAEGETEEAVAARCRGYADRFWAEADAEGETFALPTAALYLKMIKDEADFTAVTRKVQEVIAREANYMYKNEKADPELEKTINTYVDTYVNGNKAYNDKTLTLEEKTAHFSSFPGIDPNDKYTNAIFRMAQINSMNQELALLKDDKAAKEKMEELSLKGIPSKLFEVAEKEGKVSARTAFDAMRLGDDYAKKIVDDYIFYLAEGVTNMINIFQPDILTIGGGVCNEKDYLMVPLLRHVEREQYTRDNKNKTKVMIAALKNDAGIIGAAGLEG
jgi:hypothetical protein